MLVTRQAGAIVPIPFDELMDAASGRTAVRMVDTSTESHESAWALQIRLELADLEDRERRSALERVTGLDPKALSDRYASICGQVEAGS